MKLDGKDVVIAVLAIVIFILLLPRMSFANETSPAPAAPSNCDPNPIDINIACKKAKPDFPLAGDYIENGTKKYCCKKSS